jgi:site-specific recombinase XerC
MSRPAPQVRSLAAVPALVVAAGGRAQLRFLEFFAAAIRNPHTCRAYGRAVADFLAWCETHGVPSLTAVQPLHVAAWIEAQARELAAPTVKQRLAAVRHLFDWLVTGQVVPVNPAASVRGPAHSVRRGKTPVLAPEEARALLDAIDVTRPVGLRDRALIGLMVYAFARVGAALAMRVEDYHPVGKRWWLRLHEKGGKHHEMPAHHTLQEYLDAYLEAAEIAGDRKGPLFRSVAGRTGRLTGRAMNRGDAYRMIGRRAAAAGVATRVGCHSWRARGITAYLENGGLLEHAQQMAAHASARTTKLYDRRGDAVSLDEVERIVL